MERYRRPVQRKRYSASIPYGLWTYPLPGTTEQKIPRSVIYSGLKENCCGQFTKDIPTRSICPRKKYVDRKCIITSTLSGKDIDVLTTSGTDIFLSVYIFSGRYLPRYPVPTHGQVLIDKMYPTQCSLVCATIWIWSIHIVYDQKMAAMVRSGRWVSSVCR